MQQNSVDDAENRGIRCDADSEQQNDQDGEARLQEKLMQGVADVETWEQDEPPENTITLGITWLIGRRRTSHTMTCSGPCVADWED